MIILIISLIIVIVIFFWQISLVVAIIGGAPTIYARQKVIIKAFESVRLRKGQLVADLGCGNARVLIVAAKNFGAKGIGIEISPFYYLLAKLNVLLQGEAKNIKIIFGNFKNRSKEVEKANVVFLYLFDKIIAQIEPWIFETIKPSTRVISLAFPFKNHRALTIKTKPTIYIYQS
jgi:SAM-dependent methyltransferase